MFVDPDDWIEPELLGTSVAALERTGAQWAVWGVTEEHYDENGALAASGTCSEELLSFMMQDPFLLLPPPKTTGREVYGTDYVDRLMEKGRTLGLSDRDILATACRFTAACIRAGYRKRYRQ